MRGSYHGNVRDTDGVELMHELLNDVRTNAAHDVSRHGRNSFRVVERVAVAPIQVNQELLCHRPYTLENKIDIIAQEYTNWCVPRSQKRTKSSRRFRANWCFTTFDNDFPQWLF